jgi:Ca2+-binding RTX toxin-like protein
MAYNIDNLQQLSSFFYSQGLSQEVQSEAYNYLVGLGIMPNGLVSVDTTQGTGANLEVLTPPGGGTTINVNTDTQPQLKYVIDPGTEFLNISGSNSIGVALTTGTVDLTLTGSGNDLIYGGTGPNTLDASGSTGNDTIYGGSGPDVIIGGTGHDVLATGTGGGTVTSHSQVGGSSVLLDYTGGAAHTLTGGAGNDTLYANAGTHDSLQAGSGDQRLQDVGTSGTYSDTLSAAGTSGNDTLVGGAGNDALIGGSGNDLLEVVGIGGGGTLASGSLLGGSNQLYDFTTGSHSYTLTGAAGSDSLYAAGSGNDSLVAGSGDQWLKDTGTGGGYSDTLTAAGTSGADWLYAGSGNDSLVGGSGDEHFYTGTGNDTVTGGTGADAVFVNYNAGFENGTTNTISIDGGAGANNTAWFNDSSADATIVKSLAGVTTVTFNAGANSGQTVTTTNVQDLHFTNGTDIKG